jgi:hypothetical protein
MRRHIQLAAFTLAFMTTSLHAQIHFPGHNKKPQGEDLTWFAPYASPDPGGRAEELIHDPRFKSFLRDHLTAPQRFWNENQSLADTVFEFLSTPGAVVLEDNRFFTVDGSVPDFSPDRGLLFIDLGAAHPFIAFAAIDWTKESKTTDDAGASYSLWLFSTRDLDATSDTDATRIPPALKQALTRWSAVALDTTGKPQIITDAILVGPDGTPHRVPPTSLGITAIQDKAKS